MSKGAHERSCASPVCAAPGQGTQVKYIEVPGGNHLDIAVPNLPAIVEFLRRTREGEEGVVDGSNDGDS